MTISQQLDTIFRQFHKQLKRFIVSRVSDEDTAEDILQDVFLKVHANIERLKEPSKIESWLYQITRNSIIDYYRSKKQTEALPAELAAKEETIPPSEKLSLSIKRFVEQLPEEYRVALTLTDMQGMTQKELADTLGISLSGAKSRVQRGRKMLKDLLFACCHFEFDRSGGVVDFYPHATTCCPVCQEEK